MFYKGMNFIFFDFEATGINANGINANGTIDDDFPIEIGMILTDENLIFKDHYHSFIQWDWMNENNKWPDKYKKAYNIHKIDIETIKQYGLSPINVFKDIKKFINKNIKDCNNKPTLVSDNAYYDTLMMHKIVNCICPSDFYDIFHYTTWDINILYKAAGIEKVSEHNHDALGDAANMWHRTLRSLQKINYFEK
jgi:hypothetical protein